MKDPNSEAGAPRAKGPVMPQSGLAAPEEGRDPPWQLGFRQLSRQPSFLTLVHRYTFYKHPQVLQTP